ncbi:hypothetical protein [Streptomyces sp. NPDC088915]|uniref:hypothetical protein n=1 Tax=Streptomyces sp. NPDC088915 TaxID=3365912 RepID=UPI00381AADC0
MTDRIGAGRARTRTVTVAGRPREIPEAAPRLPTDWKGRAQVLALVITGLLTVATVVYSTMSIAEMLGGWWGYVGGGVFDTAWLVALLLAVAHRTDPERRAAADRIGWMLLAASVVVLAVHGIREGDWGLAVGGPAVSLVAKVLWHTVLSGMSRKLSPDTAAWLAVERDEAYAELAIADTAAEVLRSRGRAAQTKAALEAMYGELEPVSVRAERVADWPEPVADRPIGSATLAELRSRAMADQRRARASLEAATDAGVPVAEIVADALRHGAETGGEPRRMWPETPAETVSAQVSGAETGGDLRPETPETPASMSLRSAVHTLYRLGQRDPDQVVARLAPLFPTAPDRDSVARYLREARQAETKNQPGTGLYN